MLTVPKEWRRNMETRQFLLEEARRSPAAVRAILGECGRNVLFYVNLFCNTYDPRPATKVMPFVAYPCQDDAIARIVRAIDDGRDVAIEKSRDMGASWLNIYVVAWFFLFRPHSSGLLVSRNEDYVDKKGDRKSLFWKLDFTLAQHPKWMLPRMNRTSMHLENLDRGSTVDGESTTGDVGRGDRRTYILMDEFAAFEAQSGWNALAATTATTNSRVFNSTPKGVGNAFHQVAKKTPATEVIRLHWSQHPAKARGLYTSERNAQTGRWQVKLLDGWTGKVKVWGVAERENEARTVDFPAGYPFILDGKTRSPWYDGECARGMTSVQIAQELDIDYAGSDYSFFDQMFLDEYVRRWCREPDATGDLEFDGDSLRPLRFAPSPHGALSLWLNLDRDGGVPRGRRFVVGADVSAGTGASNSTLAVYDAATCEKVAEWANNKVLPADFARLAVAVCRFFNGALLVPDRSGPTGEVFVQKVLAEGYSHIYQSYDEDKVSRKRVQKYGVWLNPRQRNVVLEAYRDALGKVRVVNRSKRAVDECRKFIRTAGGDIEHSASAHAADPTLGAKAHGDIVIADALARLGLADATETQRPEDPETPPGSMAARMAEAARERERARADDADLGDGWDADLGPGW